MKEGSALHEAYPRTQLARVCKQGVGGRRSEEARADAAASRNSPSEREKREGGITSRKYQEVGKS